MLGPDKVAAIIELLESARQSTDMFMVTQDVAGAVNFLNGFNTGMWVLDVKVPGDIQEEVHEQRGWRINALGAQHEMKEQGLAEEAIVDELFALEIESWKLWQLRMTGGSA